MSKTIPERLHLFGPDLQQRIWQAFCEIHELAFKHVPRGELPTWYCEYPDECIENLCRQTGLEPRGHRVLLGNYALERKIQIIKVIREVTGLGLKEAKEMSERTPTTVVSSVTPDRALEIIRMFAASGGFAQSRVLPQRRKG